MRAYPQDREILAARGARNPVDPRVPYAFLIEQECNAAGQVEDVATIFLTNRECPFRCLMCDLWKNTTESPVPLGAIPEQIDYALERLPPAAQIKLYNSGNFFDRQAIPPGDYPAIAGRVRRFANVIVENHPRLCGPACAEFAALLGAGFEIALGLETVHPEVLPRLNKQMTADDFARAAEMLEGAGIAVRAFVLLRTPWLSEAEGIEWALRSLEFAFACGAACASVIPTRGGNGMMELLAVRGEFAPPSLLSLERALAAGLALGRGRVFADLWNVERLSACPACGPARITRLREMNLRQRVLPSVPCTCEEQAA